MYVMPKRPSKHEDVAQAAYRVVAEATGMIPPKPPKRRKNPAAVALGKLGGKKGGDARAAALSPKRRSEIDRKAAEKRWGSGE
jgi:hypothetical protein